MRSHRTLALVTLALATLAWLLVRTRSHEASYAASAEPERGPPPAELPAREPDAPEVRAPAECGDPARELRFEPLPEEAHELLVHLAQAATHQPVPGAEVFVLEVENEGWPRAGMEPDAATPDVEAELRARGRRLESDAHGDLRLPIPRAFLALMARKEELFGERTLCVADLPACSLDLQRSLPCSVRTRDRSGRPVADARVELGCARAEGFWSGVSDAAGETRVPNLGWLVGAHCHDEDPWYATADAACPVPPIRWFESSERPLAFELTLGAAERLRLRIAASDGTAVPLNGSISLNPWPSAGSSSKPNLRRRTYPGVALVRGEALVARGEPDSWLSVNVAVAGGEFFNDTLRLPADEARTVELTLRLPEDLQVVLARPVDADGKPLAAQEFGWGRWTRSAAGEIRESAPNTTLRSDEQGRLAWVCGRVDVDEEQSPGLAGYGLLHARCGEREFESASIPFAALGAGAVCDLGTLRLAPAVPLVHGRVLDDRGQPLARVRVGVTRTRVESGELEHWPLAGVDQELAARTDDSGAFALYGSCPGGTLSVELSRAGYALAPDSKQGEFECGSDPGLELRMQRNGEIRMSVRLTRAPERSLIWVLEADGERDGQIFEIHAHSEPGIIEHDFTNLRPGSYRVSLVGGVSVEDVLVRPGERTLDPRLLPIEPAPVDAPAEPLVLQIRDPNGRPIPDGLWLAYFEDSQAVEWHAGCVRLTGMRDLSIAFWSPGFQAWFGPCPQRSGELRLEPAPPFRLHVQVPPELRQPGWRVLVTPHVTSADGNWEFTDLLGSAEVGGDGLVTFESPGECEIYFSVQLAALDPTGLRMRDLAELQDVAGLDLRVPGADGVHELPVTADQWAAARKAFSGGH